VSLLLASACRSTGGANKRPSSSDDVGVAECDDYLWKYGRCVGGKIPSDQRKTYEDSLARMRIAWKTMAADPGARPGLSQACSLALDTARTSMGQYNCEW
jgi:hypothetical protein